MKITPHGIAVIETDSHITDKSLTSDSPQFDIFATYQK